MHAINWIRRLPFSIKVFPATRMPGGPLRKTMGRRGICYAQFTKAYRGYSKNQTKGGIDHVI